MPKPPKPPKPDHRKKLLWRLANRAHDFIKAGSSRRLEPFFDRAQDLKLSMVRFNQALSGLQQVARLSLKGWPLQNTLSTLDYALAEMNRSVSNFHNRLPPFKKALSQPLPLVSDIYRDLLALEQFFPGGVHLRTSPHPSPHPDFISVTTDPIWLEDVCFGPFLLKVNLRDLGYISAEALEPNTPQGSSDTTHPHVRSNNICLGEADLAVETACKDGRFFEALVMADSVLHNLGQDPYLPI